MGLTIHYSGTLIETSLLPQLIDEVSDIALINSWPYKILERKFPKNCFVDEVDTNKLYGITISPKDTEPICFTFLNNRKLCGILNFQLLRVNPKIDELLLYTISTKTQFSNPETHQKIILLLDYISSKYLNEFDCVDEGKYWETRNMALLIENFNRNGQIINRFLNIRNYTYFYYL